MTDTTPGDTSPGVTPTAAAPRGSATPITPADALRTIADELHAAASAVIAPGTDGDAGLEAVGRLLDDADRVFVLGAGRSGLALRMTAMRLMHLGRTVHVVGEVTTPAITAADVLLTASGSGTTTSIVRAATTAHDLGARVAAITTAPDSPLAGVADAVVVVPAPEKQAHGSGRSVQYAGGLFEQVVVLVGDALFHAAWQRSGVPAAELWPRHANLE